jgi:quercetin dioxygenase-like cupin family protein
MLCLEGQVTIHCGEHHAVLEAGDSVHYDGRVPHAVENSGTTTARIIIAITPAAFEPLIRVREGSRSAATPTQAADTIA